jgi:putative membrane protein
MRALTNVPVAIAFCVAVAPCAFAQAPSDAEIAHIVVTANQVDIDAGKLAASMASDPEVMNFGKLMVSDHTGVNKQAAVLAAKLGVKPADNATSQSLKAGQEPRTAQNAEKSGVRSRVHRQ